MGFHRGRNSDLYISCADTVWLKDRQKFKRFAGGLACFWGDYVCFLGYIYKYRHGPGHISRCGDTPSLFQLWRLFDGCPDDGGGSVDECEYEEVYPPILTVCCVCLVFCAGLVFARLTQRIKDGRLREVIFLILFTGRVKRGNSGWWMKQIMKARPYGASFLRGECG